MCATQDWTRRTSLMLKVLSWQLKGSFRTGTTSSHLPSKRARRWPITVFPLLNKANVLFQVLIAAHGNSLRALVKYLDGVSETDIVELNIPTGIPLVYELDKVWPFQRPRQDYWWDFEYRTWSQLSTTTWLTKKRSKRPNRVWPRKAKPSKWNDVVSLGEYYI